MAKVLVQPEGSMEIEGSVQGVLASGSRTLYVAGQTSQDANGDIVGPGDFAKQCHQVLDNLERVLAAAGATVADVVKTTVYVVDYDQQKLEQLVGVVYERYGESAQPSADTLVGVERLYMPELLLEVDAIAVLD
jgi:enamine deaminase RidA (YjgF/YER057c/UK114 family)